MLSFVANEVSDNSVTVDVKLTNIPGDIDDIASIDINEAINTLGEIIGETVSESIVNEIFHNFCVGK